MFPDPRRRRPRFEYPGSAGAGPQHSSVAAPSYIPTVRLRVLTLHVLPNVYSPDSSISASAVPVSHALLCSFLLLSRCRLSAGLSVLRSCLFSLQRCLGTGDRRPDPPSAHRATTSIRTLGRLPRHARAVTPSPSPSPRDASGSSTPINVISGCLQGLTQCLVTTVLYSAQRLEVRPSLCLYQQSFPFVPE